VAPLPFLTSSWSATEGYRVGQILARDRGITAVFAANDAFALGVIKALDEADLRVPDDVSVVGFDDLKEAAFFRPALTTVLLDFEAIGRTAVARIVATINGERETDTSLIEPVFVLRDSTAPPHVS
jgi:DNA-binding LacI/PurR family transcriptional regulator